MLSLSLPARPNLRHRFLGHRGYARNVDASSQMETSCQGRQHLQQRRLGPGPQGKGKASWPEGGRAWKPRCCPSPSPSDAQLEPGGGPRAATNLSPILSLPSPSCPFLVPLCAGAMSPQGFQTHTGMGTVQTSYVVGKCSGPRGEFDRCRTSDHPPDTICVLAGGFYSPTS